MNELVADFRYALRALRRAPGFAIVAVLTLALGIGANSAIFSVLNGVVLRPLPYAEPDRLVRVVSQFPSLDFDRFWISPPEFFELRERNRSFASLGGYRTGMSSIGAPEAPLRVTSAVVTHDLFETLGVSARIGRTYTAEEDHPDGERVVVLSHSLWASAYHGDPAVVGTDVLLNGNPTRIIGVMPPSFDIADARVQVFVPARLDPANRQNRGSHFLEVVARLAPGVTLEQARGDVARMVAQWSELNPETHTPSPEGHPILIAGLLKDDMIGHVRPALMLLLGAVAFVLLIACANIANLLLVRAESRQREIAVRAALGAGGRRLLRQFMVEGVVLAALGGATGLLLGHIGVRLLLATNPDGVPRSVEIGLDARVLLFTLGLTLLTGLLFGLAPAIHAAAGRMTGALRDGSGRTTAGVNRLQVRRALVVSEIALAVMLVVGSGLMLRSFAELLRVDPGFQPDGLLSFQISLPAANYPDAASQVTFFDQLLPRLHGLPGVTDVAAMSGMPPRRDVNANDTDFEGLPMGPDHPAHNTDYWQFVTRDYLSTMRIPIAAGRDFTLADEGGDAPVVLVNERLARVFYPDTDPIGRRLRPPGGDAVPWFTIVGVVRDVKQGGLDEETGTEVYFLAPQGGRVGGFFPRTMNIVIRTAGDPMQVAGAARRELRELDPTLPVANLATMNDVLADSLAQPRFLTLLLGIFAGVALALAAIGTYGVLAYSVAQRRQEIGIRMAVGARSRDVITMVISQGLGVALVGLAIGTAGALALSRLLQSMLYNVSATDVRTFLTAPALLAVVALLASLIPAHSASRVDPARVLKQD